ncbi:transposase [Bifidobacterium pullorum]|uniref:transposase n=1 Tax=Bifidobacterium pullorum TaxID=78448 RepID=UPI0025A3B3B7|nr:transposase [Bifidobacterium pullorum]MDM8323323.1 transposase [Bifidobacterium pullorum]
MKSVFKRLLNVKDMMVEDVSLDVSPLRDALDRVGKRLRNQARRDGNTTATEAMRGVEYAVPRNPGDLTGRQSTALATLADADPKGQLHRSWQLRELLRTLPRQPVERAEAELKRWIGRASRCRIPEIVELCGKIRRRRDDILTTIRLGYSNARIEAFNNKIKVTIRMAYGFRNTDNLIAMIKLRCSGLPIHLPTHPLTHENSRSLLFIRSESWPSR